MSEVSRIIGVLLCKLGRHKQGEFIKTTYYSTQPNGPGSRHFEHVTNYWRCARCGEVFTVSYIHSWESMYNRCPIKDSWIRVDRPDE